MNVEYYVVLLRDSIYGSESYGELVNVISDKINSNKFFLDILNLSLDFKTRSIYRAIAVILSELKPEILKDSRNIIERTLTFKDSRVWFDLVYPIIVNIEYEGFAKYFCMGLFYEDDWVSNYFFRQLPTLDIGAIDKILDFVEDDNIKKYLKLFGSSADLPLVWYERNLNNDSRFIRNITFRLLESSDILSFNEFYDLMRSVDDEELFDNFVYRSKFSIELYDV